MYAFRPMTREAAAAITAWRYPEPYALYSQPPDHQQETVQGLLDPGNAYEAIHDGDGLIGFWCCGPDARVAGGPQDDDALDLGLGLRPDLTGQGRGRGLLQAVVERAAALYGPRALRVTIAAFNARARRVWESAGFREVGRFQRPSDRLLFVVLASVS